MNFKYILFIGFILSNNLKSTEPSSQTSLDLYPFSPTVITALTPSHPTLETALSETIPHLDSLLIILNKLKAEEYWETQEKGFSPNSYYGIPAEAKIILAAANTYSFLNIPNSSIETNPKLKDALRLYGEYLTATKIHTTKCSDKNFREDECNELYSTIERIREEIKLGYYFLKKENEDSSTE